jgi:hypothetical protein
MEMTNTVRKNIEPLILKDMNIPYNTERWKPRNFRGMQMGRFNAEGDRNFCIFVDPKQVDVDKLIEDGWNIKKNENPRDPQAEPTYLLRVKVKYHPLDDDLSRLNPKILVVTSKGEMMMDEENVGDLDTAQIIKANLTIRGRWSESPTYTGITAYLSKMVVRIYEEEGSLDDLKVGIMD